MRKKIKVNIKAVLNVWDMFAKMILSKMNISKFYPSINHEILKNYRKKIKCKNHKIIGRNN